MAATSGTMQRFGLNELLAHHAGVEGDWVEFLRVSTLSCGLYRLPAGGVDGQEPHREDEIYYVISGTAAFTCDGRTVPAVTGDTIFVAANAEHRFHDITEDLTLLVIFAPPYSN